MAHSHSHATPAEGNERQLRLALGLTGTFLIVEVVGAFALNSLALLSDAAHMGTDAAALGIALFATRLARRAPDAKRSFGYHRAEIIAAVINALLLFAVAIYIGFEAWQRMREPSMPNSFGMLVVATAGLLVNLVSMRLLRAGSTANLNMKGAYLEVWSDMLGSVGVILGAVVIWITDWPWVDPLIALGIAVWVLPRTWVLLKESMNVLLEGVPSGLSLEKIKAELLSQHGVKGIHHLHVWALASSKPSLTAHVVYDPQIVGSDVLIKRLNKRLTDQFHIQHSTLQCEIESLGDETCIVDSETPPHTQGAAANAAGHDHRNSPTGSKSL